MGQNQVYPLMVSTLVLLLMLSFQNCGKLEQLPVQDGIYHKISSDSFEVSPAPRSAEEKIEAQLFDFESEEIQFRLKSEDLEQISEKSNLCFENQIQCSEVPQSTKKQCLEKKVREFLQCHGYRIIQKDVCVLAAKNRSTFVSQPIRIVSVCFDNPLFNVETTLKSKITFKRALHLGECQNGNTADPHAWLPAHQLINSFNLEFQSPGKKMLDLAQETDRPSGINDACGEPQLASFMNLNLEIQVR